MSRDVANFKDIPVQEAIKLRWEIQDHWALLSLKYINKGIVAKNLVLVVSVHVRLKPVYSTTEST